MNDHTSVLAMSILAVTLAGPTRAQDHTPGARLAAQLPSITGSLADFQLLSGSLAVAQDGQIAFEASYGMANYEDEVPNGPDTRFCIASVSKPMTALAVARLVAEDQLALDATVDTWIEGMPAGDRMTLRHLLGHEAGIPHRVTTVFEQNQPFTAAMIVARVKQRPLLFAPGTDSRYSTAGYSVIARIIELVTGNDYDAAMRALVFEPFGMHSTRHVANDVELPGRAECYQRTLDGMARAMPQDLSFLVGGGSLYSTAGDLVRFGLGCLERKALPERSWSVFERDLGWDRGDALRWNGKTSQFGAYLDVHRDSNIVVAFAGNAGVGGGALLRDTIPKILTGEPLPQPVRFAKRPYTEANAGRFLGRYRRQDGIELEVTVASGFLQTRGGGLFLPTADGAFFSPTYGCAVEFVGNSDGTVRALRYLPVGLAPVVFRRVGE
ncbi:MAG: serine hydrolase domain-containing protein [Planctomycetota bacterium]